MSTRLPILKKLMCPKNIYTEFAHNMLSCHRALFIVIFVLILAACTQITVTPITPTDSLPTPIRHSPPTSTAMPPKLISLPPQGLYDSCVPDAADCMNHLNTLAEKGFTLILNYGQLYGMTASQIAYADRAQSLGMKVIWSIQYRPDMPADWMTSK